MRAQGIRSSGILVLIIQTLYNVIDLDHQNALVNKTTGIPPKI